MTEACEVELLGKQFCAEIAMVHLIQGIEKVTPQP